MNDYELDSFKQQQLIDLDNIRNLINTDITEAKRQAFERLYNAGIIDKDGNIREVYK